MARSCKDTDYSNMTVAELTAEEQKTRSELLTSRFKVSIGQQQNTNILGTLKKRLARILTARNVQVQAAENNEG